MCSPQRTKRTMPVAPSRVRAGHQGGLVEGDAADRPADEVPHAGFQPEPVPRGVPQHGRILRAAVPLELVVGVDVPRVVPPAAGGILEPGVHEGGAGHLIASEGRAHGGSGEAVSAGLDLFHLGEIPGEVGAAPTSRRSGTGVGAGLDHGPRRRRETDAVRVRPCARLRTPRRRGRWRSGLRAPPGAPSPPWAGLDRGARLPASPRRCAGPWAAESRCPDRRGCPGGTRRCSRRPAARCSTSSCLSTDRRAPTSPAGGASAGDDVSRPARPVARVPATSGGRGGGGPGVIAVRVPGREPCRDDCARVAAPERR